MANNRYLQGRKFEYERKRIWETIGFHVIRAAGSHGKFDLIAFQEGGTLVHAIQCKRAKTEKQAERMLRAFEQNPPMLPSEHFMQVLEVYVPRLGVLSTSVCA